MKFKSERSLRVTRFFFALIPCVIVGLVLFLKFTPRVLHTGTLFVLFLMGMLCFDYFYALQGNPSGQEKMRTDKSYRIKTYWYVVALIIILFIFEILRYITSIK